MTSPSTVFVVVAALALVQPAPPELTGPVNDFADVIDPEDEAALDDLIRKLETASGDALVVATIKTFQPAADIRMYATEMFENHGKGVGRKGRDNGLLLLLAVDDREVWAEVGYDLEAIITDGFAGETSRNVMVPHFRKGNYGDGLVAGATRLAQRIAEARNVKLDAVPVREPAVDDEDGEFPIIVFIFLAMIAINVIRSAMASLFGSRRGRRRRRRWTSTVGPFGAGYGGWSGGSGGWSGGGGFGGGFGGFGGGRSGGGGGGASW